MNLSWQIGSSRRRRVLLVDIFSICFGIGAWVAVNGLWVELPLLVSALPEGWNLPSYLSIIIQIANIGPIVWSVMRSYSRNLKEGPGIYTVLTVGVLASLLLVFLWKETSVIFGVEHSTALLSLVFILAIVDCTSSVLFIPFMAVFRQTYLTSYLVGEGLSGLLPSLVALVQGVGGNPTCVNVTVNGTTIIQPYYKDPLFSVEVFFAILFGMMCASLAAFVSLNFVPACKKEKVKNLEKLEVRYSEAPSSNSTSPVPEDDEELQRRAISRRTYFVLLAAQAWVCCLSNGALPSIQSFACLPYGNTAYHLAVTLSSMANPLACGIAFISPKWRGNIVSGCFIVGTATSIFIIAMAAMSPFPLLVGTTGGEFITASQLFLRLICSFTFAQFSQELPPSASNKFEYSSNFREEYKLQT